MFLALIGLGLGFDSLWLLVALALFYLVIRYGVVAREEAYLGRKFGAAYSTTRQARAAGSSQTPSCPSSRCLVARRPLMAG